VLLRERVANPGAAVHAYRSGAAGRVRWAVREALLRLSPALATRAFTHHGALLCRAPEG